MIGGGEKEERGGGGGGGEGRHLLPPNKLLSFVFVFLLWGVVKCS